MSDVSIFLSTHLLFLTSSIVGSLLFYFWSRPSKWEIGVTLIGAFSLAWGFGLSGKPYAQVMVFLAYWGACAMVASFVMPFLPGAEVKKRVTTLEMMACPPLLVLLSSLLLVLLNEFVPDTLDYYLFAADTSFGYAPSFWAHQFMAEHGWVRLLTEAAYINLALAICVSYLLQTKISPSRGRSFLMLILILGGVGSLFYLVFPGAGALVVFGGTYIPPALADVSIFQSPDPGEPRNCIPSLHTAWSLALWWTCPRGLWKRIPMGIYVVLTLFYTLAGVGHYLVDMIAAVPFTLAVYAAARPWHAGTLRTTVSSGALFLAWLVALRFGTEIALLSPAIPILATLATLAICEVLRRNLEQSAGLGVVVEEKESSLLQGPRRLVS